MPRLVIFAALLLSFAVTAPASGAVRDAPPATISEPAAPVKPAWEPPPPVVGPRYGAPVREWVNDEDFCADDYKDAFGVWVRDPRWYAGECALRDYFGGPGEGVWSGADHGGFGDSAGW